MCVGGGQLGEKVGSSGRCRIGWATRRACDTARWAYAARPHDTYIFRGQEEKEKSPPHHHHHQFRNAMQYVRGGHQCRCCGLRLGNTREGGRYVKEQRVCASSGYARRLLAQPSGGSGRACHRACRHTPSVPSRSLGSGQEVAREDEFATGGGHHRNNNPGAMPPGRFVQFSM